MTLRDVAARLRADAANVRGVRARLRVTFAERYYLEAKDIEQGLARVADAIQLIAGDTARLADQVGEPELVIAGADPREHWPVDHARGE